MEKSAESSLDDLNNQEVLMNMHVSEGHIRPKSMSVMQQTHETAVLLNEEQSQLKARRRNERCVILVSLLAVVLLVILIACLMDWSFFHTNLSPVPWPIACLHFTSCELCLYQDTCAWCGTVPSSATNFNPYCYNTSVHTCEGGIQEHACATTELCTQQANCDDCSAVGCGWCALTKETGYCFSFDGVGELECQGKVSNGTCESRCGTIDTCTLCIATSCFWCNDIQGSFCFDPHDAAKELSCSAGGQVVEEVCPDVPDCSSLSNCTACLSDLNSACYWCADPTEVPTSFCFEPAITSCAHSVLSTCNVTTCDEPTNCTDCLELGCTWCGAKNSANSFCFNPELPRKPCWEGLSHVEICEVQDKCASFSSCQSCTLDPACGWCDTTCVLGTQEGPLGPVQCTSWQPYGSPCALNCSLYNEDCATCSLVDPSCGWCLYEGGSCQAGNWSQSWGACSEGFWIYHTCSIPEVRSKPENNCTIYNSCFDCVADDACGWCNSSNKFSCVNIASNPSTHCDSLNLKTCDETCASKQNCNTCANTDGCGWCLTADGVGSCLMGNATRPTYDSQNCTWWNFQTCEFACAGNKNCTDCTDDGCIWCVLPDPGLFPKQSCIPKGLIAECHGGNPVVYPSECTLYQTAIEWLGGYPPSAPINPLYSALENKTIWSVGCVIYGSLDKGSGPPPAFTIIYTIENCTTGVAALIPVLINNFTSEASEFELPPRDEFYILAIYDNRMLVVDVMNNHTYGNEHIIPEIDWTPFTAFVDPWNRVWIPSTNGSVLLINSHFKVQQFYNFNIPGNPALLGAAWVPTYNDTFVYLLFEGLQTVMILPYSPLGRGIHNATYRTYMDFSGTNLIPTDIAMDHNLDIWLSFINSQDNTGEVYCYDIVSYSPNPYYQITVPQAVESIQFGLDTFQLFITTADSSQGPGAIYYSPTFITGILAIFVPANLDEL